MSMVRAMRMLAAMENGSLDATGLQSLLSGSAARLGEFVALLNTRSLYDRIASSGPAMDAIMTSALAQTAVTEVRYWQELLSAFASAKAAKMAMHSSDTVLAWIGSAENRVAVLRQARGYSVNSVTISGTTPASINGAAGTKQILLGLSGGLSSGIQHTINTKRSGSGISNIFALNGIGGTSGEYLRCCLPLIPTYTAQASNAGSAPLYLGMLRCDV